MSCCNINYSKNYDTVITNGFKSSFSSSQRDAVSREDMPNTTGWFPIIARYSPRGNAFYTPQLSMPQITGYTLFDPLNCNNADFTDRGTSDPDSTNMDSSYCEQWSPENNASIQTGRMKKADGTQAPVSREGGLSDVTTHQSDVYHGIPYLMTQYASGFMDNKFDGTFPLTMNSPVGWNSVVESIPEEGENKRYADWHIMPRMGEIDYDPMTSQYLNERDHSMAKKKAMIAHKTAGNFILFNIGDVFQEDDADWEDDYQAYADILEPLLVDTSQGEKINERGAWDLKLPEPEEFTQPYGFDAFTYNNVFVGDKKRLSYWKWDINKCSAAWVLKTDEEIKIEVGEESDKMDYITYIPSGDCFIAKIDPIEPENKASASQMNNNGEKRCPSGVKFIDEGTIYTIPHNSYAVYISCNIYPVFYEAFNALKKITKSIENFMPSEPDEKGDPNNTLYRLVEQAMYVATHPLVDKITVDLHKNNTQSAEKVTPHIWGGYLNPQYSYMNAYDKNYASFGNLNLCKTWTDLGRTINNKYGSYFSEEIQIGSESFAPYSSSHIGVDMLYDLYAKGGSFRTRGRQSTDYKDMTPWYPDFQVSLGGLTLKVADERSLIERTHYTYDGDEGTCILEDWKAFSNLQLNDKTLYSRYLQSGLYEMNSYYIRNVNEGGGSIRDYCDICDEYSTYENYGGAENCVSSEDQFPFCDCDENPDPEKYPELPCVGISDNTLRLERKYEVIVDTNSFPINMAFHLDGGAYYRARNLEETGFDEDRSVAGWGSMKLRFASFDTRVAQTRAWAIDVYQLQTDDPRTVSCERFPVLENCEQSKILYDDTYPIQKNTLRYSHNTAYTPAQSTKYSPPLKKYGGYNEEKLKELFPKYGFPSIGQKVRSKTTYRIDPDHPFGCESNDYLVHENYVRSTIKIELNNQNDPYCDLLISARETVDITGPRYNITFDEFGNEEQILNQDFKRFSTSVIYQTEEPEPSQGSPDVKNNGVIWPGGGDFPVPDQDKKKDDWYLTFENSFLMQLMQTAGVLNPEDEDSGLSPNIFPGIENPQHQFENIYFDDVSYTLCNNKELWFDFGDQTSSVRLTFLKRPRPVKAKFALFAPTPIELGENVKFDFNQIKTDDEDMATIMPSYFRNQLDSDQMPKYTFNNDIASEEELPEAASWKISSEQAKSLAPLFRTVHSFDSNRKMRIIFKAKGQEGYWELKTLPTRYYSHKKSWQGFPHFVKPVFQGLETNYIPGMVPYVQRTPAPEDSRWIIKPNTEYASDKAGLIMGEDATAFDPDWPLNLQLNNYRVNLADNTVTFPGARMFFAMFPEIETWKGAASQAPVGSLVRIGNFIYYKIQDGSPKTDERFQDYFLIFNPFDTYTWQKYSDLHIDFSNTSYAGYVYNGSFDLPNVPFYFYRYPFGDRSKIKKALATKISLRSTLQDSSGRRIFPASLIDGCVDYCQEGGVSYLKIETEIKFATKLNKDWLEINGKKTPISSYHIYHPECVGAEKDRLLVNDKYATKWADLEHFDDIIFDHWIANEVGESYYPQSRYLNTFYKTIVDNGNYINTQQNSILPEAGPFRFMVHQKYSVDYDAGEPVAARRISGVHNYLPFLDINDKSALQSANYLITEPSDNFDGLLRPVAEDENGVIRPDLEFVLTVPAECELERVWLPSVGQNEALLSESLRMDTPQYWIENIDKETNDRCDGEKLSTIYPNPKTGKQYGISFNSVVRGIRSASVSDDGSFPTATWNPEAYAIWTQYCDFDPKGCNPPGTDPKAGIKPCYMNQGGSTELKAEYKFADPNIVPFKNVAKDLSEVYITYDAGIMNGMNGYRPPMILRSISGPTYNRTSQNNIQYSQDYPDPCNDRVVLPPLYQYPEWDEEVSDTFMAGADAWQKVALENRRAGEVFYADAYAEEMTFRALYGEVEFVNRQSINGTSKLKANEIINYVDPEITVSEMHDQILWDYDKGGDRIQRPKVEGFFTVKAPMSDGESVSVTVNGEIITANITAAAGGNYIGSTMNITFKNETYSFPVRMTEATYSTMISVESDAAPPEFEDGSSLELIQKGRIVEPYEKYVDVSCQSAVEGCPVNYPPTYDDIDKDWGPGESRTYLQNVSQVDMGDWYSMITLVPTADVYRWYDTYDVCESTPESFGPYSRRCKPYTYGYCNYDKTDCPPCVPPRGNETQFLEGNAKKSYYTNKNVWVNNFVGSDNEQYQYEWRYCRNLFQNYGYFNRDNFSYHPSDVYRTDLVLEYAGEYNAILEAYANCVGECNGDCGCYCATPKNQGIGWYPGRPNGTKEGWGWCDFERNVCPWGTYPGQTGEVPPNYYKCADCECIGDTSWLPSTADPIPDESYAPFGNAGSCFCRGGPGGGGNGGCGQNPPQACYQRYCYPATVACAEGKDASAADSSWWPSFGYDPDTGEAYTHTLCYPKGYCNSAHDSWTRTGPKYEWRDGECGFPYRKRVNRYSRAGNFSYYRDRCNWGRATCMYSCVDDGNEFAPPGSNVIDYQYETVTETKEVRYDTYIKDTQYGGGRGGICNSGLLFDGCPNTWFTVSYTNNKIDLTFQSGSVSWIEYDESPGGLERCAGAALTAENVTICETVKYQANPDVTASFNNELGHLDNYSQTTDCNCGEDISVGVPSQTPQWATRTMEGKCYVSQWMEEHVHDNVFTAGYNWSAVCQSNQSLGRSYFGFLQGYNDGDCYNNAAGSDCPVDRPWYGVAQGTLNGADCKDSVTCAIGKRNWEEEQNNYHARKLEQYRDANESIPEENILEGLIPGSMTELKFKTYSVEGGKAVRANQDQFGASVEDININVTIAYYEYKYRVRWDINDAIAQQRGETYFIPSEGVGASEDDFQSCLGGRPFGPADVSDLEGADFFNNESESFQFQKLNYRCDGSSGFTYGRPYPNWYDLQVAPHGCLPRYGEYYGRYDSPPDNFIWTVPTISQDSCTKRRTCYYNDKQWPAERDDAYLLSSQPTFLHCHKYLSKNWIYDYVRGSPFG